MLKFYDYAVTFAEFPEEISLLLNITNCPMKCEHCSEPYLAQDIGEELTNEKIDELISNNSDITLFGLMGGDSDYDDVVRVANYIHNKYPNIKVGMYSGNESLYMKLLEVLDYYKIGRFVALDTNNCNYGPISFPLSNQLMFKKEGNKWKNITYKFRENKISNINNYIV